MRRLDCAPEWWEEKILNQESGQANWQHGQLYVTPSRGSAVRYAGYNAAYGGELLTSCMSAIDELAKYDPDTAERLVNKCDGICGFLREDGSPILIEFSNVEVCCLSPEIQSNDVRNVLSELEKMDERMREIMGQQSNFILAPNGGTVAGVYDLSIEDVNSPTSPFECHPVYDLDL